MSHGQQGRCLPPEVGEDLAEGVGVEGGEALVQDDQLGAMEQGLRQLQAAALAVAELPAGLAEDLMSSPREC
jgi:hypothetical protein